MNFGKNNQLISAMAELKDADYSKNPKLGDIYKRLLKPTAEIHQKTDNMHFFEFSIEQFTLGGFKLKNISLDLHNSDFEGNIETEYEHRFASLGQPIYRLEAYLND